ncbi:hypothetical protein CI109_101064 [Kwoniella shandongensis]|uniref:Uncharacterized protein n=1 Tax=Kwoniella shandongensis TaxID=1734106 RepID=A0A5M6C4M5_9TREE|nr:uncharacterized protein CI109_001533 [Kwoniella shandongensis]KAA5530127.1 hypothetical protein CI109_001533 [Kwoniella shandongensis]
MQRSTSDDELASLVQHISIDYGTEPSFKAPDLEVLTNTLETKVGQWSPTRDQPEHEQPPAVEADTALEGSTSYGNHSLEYTALNDRIQSLTHEVAILLDRLYEIQELRHSSLPDTITQPHSNSAPGSRIDTLIQSLTDTITLLRPQITALQPDITRYHGDGSNDLSDGVEELMGDWKRAEEQHRLLKEEMKEDGWLVRFRTTSDQAEAMMDPLRKSLAECLRYVERITNPEMPIPYESQFDDQPNIKDLQKLAKSHQSMTKTYVPSINKILKMIERSISERPVKNGEALRRFSEMSQQWIALQKHLQQLEARIRLIVSQNSQMKYLASPGDVEVLADLTSPYGSSESRLDYFGHDDDKPPYSNQLGRGPPGSHRSSVSSNVSSSSTRSMLGRHPPASPSMRPIPSNFSPENTLRPQSQRTRAPVVLNGSIRNGNEAMTTPVSRRTNSASQLLRSVSPTPSTTSVTSTASRRQSRIPVYSPTGSRAVISPAHSDFGEERLIPGLTVSNSHSQTLLTEPSSIGRTRRTSQGQGHLERSRMGLKTPESTRPRLSSSFSAFQPRPSVGTPTMGSRTYSTGTTPRTAPTGGRQSLARAPPSSFRLTSPTPNGSSRPSSRLSMMSYSNFDSKTLQPFQPSRYDLLDQEVAKILEQEKFDLFVGRLDAPLKKGQRRTDNEEWKGEYLFGAGEKPTSVKLLKLAGGGRVGSGKEIRMKCLVRVGGAWHDLGGVLRKRKAEAGGET